MVAIQRIRGPLTAAKSFFTFRSEITAHAVPSAASATPAVAPLLRKSRYPPAPRSVTELVVLEARSASVESPQTNAPV